MNDKNSYEHIIKTLGKFFLARSFAESKIILEQNPELLTPVALENAKKLVEKSIEDIKNELRKKYLIQLGYLLGRCVIVGIEKAYLEVLNDLYKFGIEAFEKYKISLNPKDLDSAINKFKEAKELAPNDLQNKHFILNKCGLSLFARYRICGSLSDLEEAVAACEEAYKLVPPNSADAIIYSKNLGGFLIRHFEHIGDIMDLEKAIMYLDSSIKNAPSISECLSNRAMLGNALTMRYERFKDPSDLDWSRKLLEEAFNGSSIESEIIPDILTSLGIVYRLRSLTPLGPFGAYTGVDIAKLNDSIYFCNQAVVKSASNSPNLPNYFNNLGISLRMLFEVLKLPSIIEEAIQSFEKALTMLPSTSPYRQRIQKNLANCLQLRHDISDNPADLEEVISNYEHAASTALNTQIEMVMNTSRDWLLWAFSRKKWNEVVKAYKYFKEGAERLLQVQVLRKNKEAWLKEIQGIAGRVAYAMTKLGDSMQAVITLESSTALLLRDALKIDQAKLNKLKNTKHQELYEQYHLKTDRIIGIERSVQDARSSKQSSGTGAELLIEYKELDKVISDIRKIQGYEDFLIDPTIDSIRDIIRKKPLVYLITTEIGSLGLIVEPNSDKIIDDDIVWLDNFNLDDLKNVLFGFGHYLYGAALGDSEKLKQVLIKIFPILENHIIGPIIDNLIKLGYKNATLIPTGNLDLLPLHSVSKKTFNFSFAPSAKALVSAYRNDREKQAFIDNTKKTKTGSYPPVLLAVGNPLPNPKPLIFAHNEIKEIMNKFPSNSKLREFSEYDSKLTEVCKAISGATHIHFACHGNFNTKKPLNSSLSLSGKEKISLSLLLYGSLDFSSTRLVVLSACQTGLTEFYVIPDEAVGFPAAFIQAGIPNVISTLWLVDDVSTSLLMSHFYEKLKNGLSPSQALYEAQDYLRKKITRPFVINYIKSFINTLEKETSGSPFSEKNLSIMLQIELLNSYINKQKESEKKDPGGKPFDNPYYWAAFAVSGADTCV